MQVYQFTPAHASSTVAPSGVVDHVPVILADSQPFANLTVSVDPTPSITVLDEGDPIPVGDTHNIAVRVIGDNGDLAGAVVQLLITSGPNAGLTSSATTAIDSSCSGYALAFFNYSSSAAGFDTISLSTVVDGNTLTAVDGVEWFIPSSTISFSSPTIAPGQTDSFTVSGYASTWEGFSGTNHCEPSSHEGVLTFTDGPYTYQTTSVSPYYSDGIVGVSFPLSITPTSGGGYRISAGGFNDIFAPDLPFGAVTMQLTTPDLINRYVIMDQGQYGGDLVVSDQVDKSAATTFQFNPNATGVPEFPAGLFALMIAAIPAIFLLRRGWRATPVERALRQTSSEWR
jgi:hypothetical protein